MLEKGKKLVSQVSLCCDFVFTGDIVYVNTVTNSTHQTQTLLAPSSDIKATRGQC